METDLTERSVSSYVCSSSFSRSVLDLADHIVDVLKMGIEGGAVDQSVFTDFANGNLGLGSFSWKKIPGAFLEHGVGAPIPAVLFLIHDKISFKNPTHV